MAVNLVILMLVVGVYVTKVSLTDIHILTHKGRTI